MWNVYLICAAVGGTVFVLQMILTLIGGGGHDFDGHDGSQVADHDAHFWGIFGLRAIVAGVTAFGLGGLLVQSAGGTTVLSTPVAIGSFFVAALLVAGMLRAMGKFSSDGTAHIEQSVGRPAVVYVNIPADRQGSGKVHLHLQNRTVEVEAITYGNALETGTRVVVTSVIGSNMVEVIAAPEMSKEYSAA